MIKPELRTLKPAIPGQAHLILRDWQGDMQETLVSITRNQDNYFLDAEGNWRSGEVFIRLPELTLTEGQPSVKVGALMVDPLLVNRQMSYRMTVKDSASQSIGILKMDNGLLSSQAAGSTAAAEAPRVLADVPPTPEEVIPPAPELQQTVQEQPISRPIAKRSNKPLWLAGLLLLLVIIALAAWWYLRQSSALPQSPLATKATAAVATGPCSSDTMGKGTDLDFVKGCLHSQPASTELLAVIDAAKAAKRCDIAQRLYAYKAQSGDTQIALRYAHEYDPETASKEGCFSADAQTAIYWYENVVSQDSQNSEAKARLTALKKQGS